MSKDKEKRIREEEKRTREEEQREMFTVIFARALVLEGISLVDFFTQIPGLNPPTERARAKATTNPNAKTSSWQHNSAIALGNHVVSSSRLAAEVQKLLTSMFSGKYAAARGFDMSTELRRFVDRAVAATPDLEAGTKKESNPAHVGASSLLVISKPRHATNHHRAQHQLANHHHRARRQLTNHHHRSPPSLSDEAVSVEGFLRGLWLPREAHPGLAGLELLYDAYTPICSCFWEVLALGRRNLLSFALVLIDDSFWSVVALPCIVVLLSVFSTALTWIKPVRAHWALTVAVCLDMSLVVLVIGELWVAAVANS